MQLVSALRDNRIDAHNVLFEMTISEYERVTRDILENNEFQRKRVRASKSVYALLREDLLKNCVIPPIVLALTKEFEFDPENLGPLYDHLNMNSKELVVLDGLQRTHTILGLLNDLKNNDPNDELEQFQKSKIRVEIYVGLNRLGILYRMLTLNTGQTPMSLRQQIEILYLDYIDSDIPGSNMVLIRESDNTSATAAHQYNFKDVIEGFNAYLERDPLPIDKANILENISTLEKLSREDHKSQLFEGFLVALDRLLSKISDLTSNTEISEDYTSEKGIPFGKNYLQIFKKPQAISGFGAAIGKLIDFDVIDKIDDLHSVIEKLDLEEPQLFLEEMNDSLLWLKDNSTKIGNAQRNYFTFFYRDLFNGEADSFKDLHLSSKSALRKYQAQNS